MARSRSWRGLVIVAVQLVVLGHCTALLLEVLYTAAMATTKKLTSYRLSAQDLDRVERLSELLGGLPHAGHQRRHRVLAGLHGVLAGETAGRVRALIDKYGPASEVALAVQQGTSRVPVSIAGKPVTELVAAAWLRPPTLDDDDEDEDGRPALPEPVGVTLWLRNSSPTIKFLTDPQRPGTTVRFPVASLWERWIIAPEPSAESIRSNAEIRAAAGYQQQEDNDEEVSP